MAKFVVISKLNSEMKSESAEHLPGNWPIEAKEFETAEEAMEAYPGRKVYTVEEYKHFSDGLAFAYMTHPIKKKRSLKFWRKG